MSTDSFVAIDVETANADLASICQIGLVTFADGQIVSGWQSLIDPEDEFNEINISIHGIDESSVQGAPRFNDLAVHIGKTLEGQVVASHTSFDRVASTVFIRSTRFRWSSAGGWIQLGSFAGLGHNLRSVGTGLPKSLSSVAFSFNTTVLSRTPERPEKSWSGRSRRPVSGSMIGWCGSRNPLTPTGRRMPGLAIQTVSCSVKRSYLLEPFQCPGAKLLIWPRQRVVLYRVPFGRPQRFWSSAIRT